VTASLRAAVVGALAWALVAGPAVAVAQTAEPCTGSVVGRLVRTDGTPAAGERIQLTGMPGDPDGQQKLGRAAADGSFRVDGVPVGRHNGFARHARFAFVLGGGSCGQIVDLGAVEYPAVHPAVLPDRPRGRGAGALHGRPDRARRADRAGHAHRGAAPRATAVDGVLFQVSNPCWYRYEVVSLVRWTAWAAGQPPPGAVDALVRVYTQWWHGATAVGPPESVLQALRLVETPAGWRVARLRLQEYRDEPAEPHGPTTSACTVGRRPPVWPAATLPATGGLPAGGPLVVAAVGLALAGAGVTLRGRRGGDTTPGTRETGP
jgi:hypothetical protein